MSLPTGYAHVLEGIADRIRTNEAVFNRKDQVMAHVAEALEAWAREDHAGAARLLQTAVDLIEDQGD